MLDRDTGLNMENKDIDKTRKRWVDFMQNHGFAGNILAMDAVKVAMQWVAAERALEREEVLKPGSEGVAPVWPGLEAHLKSVTYAVLEWPDLRAVLEELDRRSALIASQMAELDELRAVMQMIADEGCAEFLAKEDAQVGRDCLSSSLPPQQWCNSCRARAALGAHPQPQSADRATRVVARPAAEYHEDYGNVLWWRFPIQEPPWCGSTLDEEFEPNYYTHWTTIAIPDNITADRAEESDKK